MRTYKNYSDLDIINNAKLVKSMSMLLKALGLKPVGGNFINMKKNVQRLDIDISHWKGQGWSKGDKLKDYSNYTTTVYLKRHLTKERGHKCESVDCGIVEWKGNPLILELDHIDGDRSNNKETNLRLLCPNCHSQTETWRNRKRKTKWSTEWK